MNRTLVDSPDGLLAELIGSLGTLRHLGESERRLTVAGRWADELAAAATGVDRARRWLIGPNVGRLWDELRAEAETRLRLALIWLAEGDRLMARTALARLLDTLATASVRRATA